MAKKKKSDDANATSASIRGKHENEWRAESDARTLTDAEAIRCDAKRLEAARGKLEHSVTAHRMALKRTKLRGRKKAMRNGRM